MSESIFDQPRFQDAEAAREYLEAIRWPNGPICPHCGTVAQHYALHGKSQRKGLYKCSDCREQFTVTVGTVFERSKIPLHKWVMLTEMMCASKKGISSKQVERMLGVTYKTAWFMTHRIREFDFRYNHREKLGYDDTQRTVEALKGISGKRLTYRRIGAQDDADV